MRRRRRCAADGAADAIERGIISCPFRTCIKMKALLSTNEPRPIGPQNSHRPLPPAGRWRPCGALPHPPWPRVTSKRLEAGGSPALARADPALTGP